MLNYEQGWLWGSCLETCKACSLPQDENLCNWQINKPIYNISAPAVLFPYLDDQKQWLTFHWHCLKNKMWWHYLDAFVVLVGPDKCWRSRSRLFFLWRGAPAAYKHPATVSSTGRGRQKADNCLDWTFHQVAPSPFHSRIIKLIPTVLNHYALNAWTILNKQEWTSVCASWQWRGKASHCQLSFSTNGGWVCHCHFQTVTRHHHHLNHFAH